MPARRRSPLRRHCAGRCIERDGARGGSWNHTDAPIMTVTDLSTVWVAASVRERDLASPVVGQAARDFVCANIRDCGAPLATGRRQAHAELGSA